MRKLSAKLKERNSKSYCGPTALTVVTGLSYEECENELKNIKKRKVIRGVSSRDLAMALVRLASHYQIKYKEYKRKIGPTLAKWLRERKKGDRSKMFLVVTTTHCLVVKGNKIYDNRYPNGVWSSQYNSRRARVFSTYLLEEQPVVGGGKWERGLVIE